MTRRGCRTEDSVLGLGHLFLVLLTLFSIKASHCHRTVEEIKLSCALHQDNLQIFPRSGTGRLHTATELSLKWPRHFTRAKGAPVDLRPCAGSSVLDKEFTAVCSEDHQARSGGRWHPLNTQCWGTALKQVRGWLTGMSSVHSELRCCE